jgi:hypothetical protein
VGLTGNIFFFVTANTCFGPSSDHHQGVCSYNYHYKFRSPRPSLSVCSYNYHYMFRSVFTPSSEVCSYTFVCITQTLDDDLRTDRNM